MARGPKPTYARIRIETLEHHIGRAIALGRTEAAQALRYFARDARIQLNDTTINEFATMYRKELAR